MAAGHCPVPLPASAGLTSMQSNSPGPGVSARPDILSSRDVDAPAFGGVDIALYAATVFAWSTSWLALSWQVGVVAIALLLAVSSAFRRHGCLPVFN